MASKMKPQKLGSRETGLTVKGGGTFEAKFFNGLSKNDLRDPDFPIPEPLKDAKVLVVEGQGASKVLKDGEIDMNGFKNKIDLKLDSPFDLFLERGMLVQKRKDVKDYTSCPCCYFAFETAPEEEKQAECWESHLGNFHEMLKISLQGEVLFFIKREHFQTRPPPPPPKKKCLKCDEHEEKIKELSLMFKRTKNGLGEVLGGMEKFIQEKFGD